MTNKEKSALQPVRDWLAKGIQVSKMTQQAEYGWFTGRPALYEYRTATTWKQLCDWSNEGFRVDNLAILTLGLSQALLGSVEILAGEDVDGGVK